MEHRSLVSSGHPTVQGFLPADKMAWPTYEVINEYKLPAIFHSGHSGIGSGMRCGGGLRLQNSNPMLLEDVAIAFADMQIVIARPSWPWRTKRSRWRCTSIERVCSPGSERAARSRP